MLHSMATLWQNMKQEVPLCLVRHGKAVLMWEACRPDHTIVKVHVAYTVEKDTKSESQ